MIGLISSIITFNLLAFKINKLNANKFVHIWTFTIAFQILFDLIIEFKYKGYSYFSKDQIEWAALLVKTILFPPINIIFLSYFPFTKVISNKIFYMAFWVAGILIYELIALFPEPWGYFKYGWWNLGYSAIVDPILFLILLSYYKWICKIEKK